LISTPTGGISWSQRPVVSVRTEPRFTRDADLAVAVRGDEEAEALVCRLRAGYDVGAIVEQEATKNLVALKVLST